jgi:malonyl-CoA/methylmalonyl-CoA synthetase
MNLTSLFDLSLQGRANSIALEFEGREFTFRELDERSNRLARYLLDNGFTPGDRLCVYLPNCVEMIDLYLACLKTGVIFVPVNILYRDREVSHIVNDARPKMVISEEKLAELAAKAQTCHTTRPYVRLEGDTPAGIIYTSGTTGVSKGAVLTHHNFAANALNLLTCWQTTAQDRFLLALPLFHVHGLGNGLHCWLISGCRMRLLKRFEYQRAEEIFLDFRPTLFFGVPTIYVRLLEMNPASAAEIGRFMRLFVSGSAPLPAHVFEEFRELYGHTILERYGMSETLMNISNPYVGERRAGTVGVPLPGVSVRLLNPALQRVHDGETGELYVRGPNVFSGYWQREEATRAAFVDGYFKTGDLAIRSPDGYYTLCGRSGDLIISGGFNIYPREIEEFLEEQPEIAAAAVLGVADSVRGEVPVAYIVTKGQITAEVLAARCREKLASFKVPRRFFEIDQLPRNAMGKVQKHLLTNSNAAPHPATSQSRADC